jgi:transposase
LLALALGEIERTRENLAQREVAFDPALPPPPAVASAARPIPDWTWVEKELRRRGVTLALLWEEYCRAHPDGFSYRWFCERYAVFKSRLRPPMRQSHDAGEKLFVDFAGDAIDVVDPMTGEVPPSSRMSTYEPRAASTALFSRSSSPATGSIALRGF